MKHLFVILFCVVLIGCSHSNSAEKTPIPSINSPTTYNLEIEKNLVALDKGSEEKIQYVKISLDYLVEHTTSSRKEIADITNKIIPELNKSGVKSTREEFLFVCKLMMQINNIEQKLGEKPDFAYLAAYVAGDLEANSK